MRATILRDSWPLSESAWPYISMIKSMEKLEERPGSKPSSAKKTKREKGAGGKKGTTPQQSNSNFNQVVGVVSTYIVASFENREWPEDILCINFADGQTTLDTQNCH